MASHNHPLVSKSDVAGLNARYAPWRIVKSVRHVGSPNRAAFDTVAENTATGAVIYRCEGWSKASRGLALNAILDALDALDPCDCGAVVGADGGYVPHIAGAAGCEDAPTIDPPREATGADGAEGCICEAPDSAHALDAASGRLLCPVGTATVERLDTGSEDGWLWYVVGARGRRLDGGYVNREDADHACALVNADGTCEDCGAPLRDAPAAQCWDCYNDAPAPAIEASSDADNQAATIAALTGDATVTAIEASAVLEWCQGWALDCDWIEDADTIAAMPALAFLAACNRALDGGLAVALADVRRLDAIEDANLELAAGAYAVSYEDAHGRPYGATIEAIDATTVGMLDRRGRLAAWRESGTGAATNPLRLLGIERTASYGAGYVAPTAALGMYTAILRQAGMPSIYELSVAALDMRAALAYANREATNRGLVLVALAVGAPDGFGAAILAAQVAEDAKL